MLVVAGALAQQTRWGGGAGERAARGPSVSVSGVVEVTAREASGGARRCLGAQIGDRWVATARHCVERAQSITVSDAGARLFAVSDASDVALLRLAENSAPTLAEPTLEADVWSQCAVFVVARRRSPRFTVSVSAAWVSSVGDELLVVSAPGGAPCVGDSGGPALACDGQRCRLLGVLRGGSSRCTGRDSYARWPAPDRWRLVT